MKKNLNILQEYDEINPELYYIVKEGVLAKGSRIISIVSESQFGVIEFAGSICIGFIIGWLLAFVNKYADKGKITITYFTSAVSTLMGATVLGFFTGSSQLIGLYGIGTMLGFLTLQIIFLFIEKNKDSTLSKLIKPYNL